MRSYSLWTILASGEVVGHSEAKRRIYIHPHGFPGTINEYEVGCGGFILRECHEAGDTRADAAALAATLAGAGLN